MQQIKQILCSLVLFALNFLSTIQAQNPQQVFAYKIDDQNVNSNLNTQNWQQQVDYNIKVRLNDSNHILEGFVTISYHNNSPETLNELYIHLWPNAYQKNSEMARQLAEDGDLALRFATNDQLGSLTEIDFKHKNLSIPFKYENETKEIVKLSIEDGIKPGSVFEITTPFQVKIPGNFSRLCHIQQDYAITQWFPKVAMYDQEGWHQMPYLNWGEFYDNFGDYKVEITVPKDYVVAATGNLQTQEELDWLLERELVSSSAIRQQDYSFLDEVRQKTPTYKTVVFEEKNVHDFAWFASKDFLVQHEEVMIDSQTTVDAWSFFSPKEANEWKEANYYLSKSVKHYSKNLGNYPYKTVKAVSGPLIAGGGMEYPTITIIGSVGNQLFRVILHEVGHNWFQGILATNERKFPYLDEGLNSFYEDKYFIEEEGLTDKKWGEAYIMKKIHTHFSRRKEDEACNMPARCYAQHNYGLVVYQKSAMALRFLESYLGAELFAQCMKTFYENFKFHHPSPQDLQHTFEQVSLQNLNWFFEGTLGKINDYDADIKVENSNEVTVSNLGELKMPVKVSVFQDDVKIKEVWVLNNGESDTTLKIVSEFDAIYLNHEVPFFETRTRNNQYVLLDGKVKSIPLKIKPLIGINQEEHRSMLIGPALAFNTSDGLNLGLYVTNANIPESKVSYAVAPMIGLGSGQPTGLGNITYNAYSLSAKNRKALELGLNASTFGIDFLEKFQYKRFEPFVRYKLKPLPLRSSITHEFQFRSVVRTDFTIENNAQVENWRSFFEMAYQYENSFPLFPYQAKVLAISGPSFVNLKAEWNSYLPYSEKNGIHLRAFAGAFIQSPDQQQYSMRLATSSYNGFQQYDYMLDQLVMDRSLNHSVFRRQILEGDGFFKLPNGVYGSTTWLPAVNLVVDLPGKIPFSLFADAAFIPENGAVIPGTSGFFAEAGISLKVAKDIFELYWPLVFTKDLQAHLDLNRRKTWSLISFRFKIEKLNLKKLGDYVAKMM